MNLFNFIPVINGYKTLVGSWTQIVAGLLMAIVELLNLVNDCLNGAVVFEACLDNLPLTFLGVVAAANGLSQLGLGHKLVKSLE